MWFIFPSIMCTKCMLYHIPGPRHRFPTLPTSVFCMAFWPVGQMSHSTWPKSVCLVGPGGNINYGRKEPWGSLRRHLVQCIYRTPHRYLSNLFLETFLDRFFHRPSQYLTTVISNLIFFFLSEVTCLSGLLLSRSNPYYNSLYESVDCYVWCKHLSSIPSRL